MPKKIEVPYHQTTDLVEAAALLTQRGCQILDVQWADDKKEIVAWFISLRSSAGTKVEDLNAFLEELHERKALVEPYAFAAALRKAKAAMYELMDTKKGDGS